MNKQIVIVIMFLLSISLASAVQVINVELLELGDNGFVIGFETDVPAPGHIWFGKTGALGDFTKVTTEKSTYHQVQVDGLQPNTVYFYRAAGKLDTAGYYTSAISLTRTANTLSGTSTQPAQAIDVSKLSFAVIGDSMSNAYSDWPNYFINKMGIERNAIGVYGIGGARCTSVKDQLSQVDSNTDVLFISCGVNGLAGVNNIAGYQAIYEEAKNKGIDTIFMTTMPPWNVINTYPSAQATTVCNKMKADNTWLLNFAATHDDVHIVDLWSRWHDTSNTQLTDCGWRKDVALQNDGVHPNAAGYAQWGSLYSDAVREWISTTTTDTTLVTPSPNTGSSVPTNSNAKLLFKSGFEGTTDVCTRSDSPSCATSYACGVDSVIKGTDNGYTWPNDLPGASSSHMIQDVIGGGCPGTKAACHTLDIVNTLGHDGTPTNALYYERIKNCNTGGGYSRLQYIMRATNSGAQYPGDDFNPIYFRAWIRMQDDLDTTFTSGWRNIWEFYYPPGPNQWTNTFHLLSSGNGQYRWLLNGKHYDSTNRDLIWAEYSTKNIPKGGEWFLMEAYVKSGVSDGRIIVKIDGEEIFNVGGSPSRRTARVEGQNPSNVALLKLSTSQSNQEQWMDDLEIWSEDPQYSK